MPKLIDKICLLLICSTQFYNSGIGMISVVAILSVVILSPLAQCYPLKWQSLAFEGAYCVLCFFDEAFLFVLPVILYDILWDKRYYLLVAGALSTVTFFSTERLWHYWLFVCCVLITVVLQLRTCSSLEMKRRVIETRDNAAELNALLNLKNKHLIESQDSEIHIATLRERNRIAREIHDNVGHLLTRTILQMGALQIINKDENLKEPLESIKTTLDTAMNTIRSSVHDLHNESVDLKESVTEACGQLKDKCMVELDYDCSNRIPVKIKYCFIGIVKEAVSNIIKHSNANQVKISIREHPAMCVLTIIDNGQNCMKTDSNGIGLENMQDRVQSINGIINIQAEDDGFRIFVSVPKKMEGKADENCGN